MTNTSDTPAAGPKPAPAGYAFFAWLRGLGFARPANGWVGGVCAGLGARTGLDPLIVRGVVLVIAVLGGPVLFFYAVAWALLPDLTGRIHAEDVVRGRFEGASVAITVIAGLSLLPFTRGLWWQGPPVAWNMPEWLTTTFGVAWSIALVAGSVWLIVYLSATQGRRAAAASDPATASTTAPTAFTATADGTTTAASAATATAAAPDGSATGSSADAADPWAPYRSAPTTSSARPADWDRINAEARKGWDEGKRGMHQAQKDLQQWRRTLPGAGHVAIVLGLAVIAGGITGGLLNDGRPSQTALVWGVAAATAVVGLGIVVAGIRGRTSGALGFFSVAGIVALLIAGVFHPGTRISPFGTPQWSVAAQGSDPAGYAIFAGAPTLDLTGLRSGSEREVDLWLGFGSATVVVPEDGSVRVETHALAGNVDRPTVGTDPDPDHGGFLLDDAVSLGSGSGDETIVRVWMLAGNVDVEVADR